MEEYEKFSFKDMDAVRKIIAKYPQGKQRSAVMPLLWLGQQQNNNWISNAVLSHIAEVLHMNTAHVKEIAEFYSMFHSKKVGKYLVQICRTVVCALCQNQMIYKAIRDTIGIDVGETSEDELFTVVEVECLGSCINAPVIMINDSYYEHLNYDKTVEILKELQKKQQSHPSNV
ncbi:NADH-quinone oxidoreductase subunit NuoE family protein [Candidatus Fokinia crypta]|uniref:NADH-quinone oxidoreductase subunit E n=1 Tax=Candidatus Fokinia crypta TaxID=1920990 RepID=A0ABZ0USZ6_9RICK|nr:NAD(P)H-dependent oxidoreductase subunit E [Candidatus Fokinia cryptica]WPX97813.1 NADH-quinone oxidoreductase subunit NuoE [Candidatus Fokinia cryptica]